MIQDLQAEKRRYQSHAKIRGDQFSESDSESGENGDGERNIQIERAEPPNLVLKRPQQHICPFCPRTTPFATKQKLRRHHEQRISPCSWGTNEAEADPLQMSPVTKFVCVVQSCSGSFESSEDTQKNAPMKANGRWRT